MQLRIQRFLSFLLGPSILFWVFSTHVLAQSITWTQLSSKTGALPPPNGGSEQTAALVLDVDKNGVSDFIIGERSAAPSVVWFRRTGTTWTKYIVDNTALRIEAGGAYYDIDQDGDDDIVFGGDSGSNQVWWWENPYPNYAVNTPWTRRLVKNTGTSYHHDEMFGDFDGDGKAELAFWNQNSRSLMLAEIPADPRATQPWTFTPIFTHPSDPVTHEGLASGDIDNDGKIDIVGAGRWLKHTGGTNFTVEIIDNTQKFSRAAVGQLKRGGRPEVVFCAGDVVGPITYHEWNGSAWTRRDLLGTNVDHGHSLQIGDINRDGNLDIFSAEMRLNGGNPAAKMRIFFGDGNGNFTMQEVASGIGNHESRLGDLDGDGDLDILTKPFNWDTPRVDVWLNNGTSRTLPYPLNQWQRRVIDESKPWRAVFITSGDMDNDGKKDIITGGHWYRNPGSTSGTWARNTIGSPLNNMALVYDFDNNGALDVVGTKGIGDQANAEFVWAKNSGSGAFSILTNIQQGDGDFLQGVALTRLLTGNPLEIALSWHLAGKGVQTLTVPSDPSTTQWSWRRLSTSSQDEEINVADIGRDGKQDIILGTKWLRNDSSAFSLLTLNPTAGDPDRSRLADINRDGREDIVVGFEAISILGKVAWYEQPANPSGTWTEHVVSTSLTGPMSVDVGDMDHDGDIDIVVGEHNLVSPATARLVVLENADGAGGSWNQVVIHTGDEHHDGAQLVDIDNDGDLDVISIGWNNPRVVLYENLANQSTSVKEKETGQLPLQFELNQNYPNPFNPSTTISFSLPKTSHVRMKVFDVLGSEIETLIAAELHAGTYEVTFDAARNASGVYFCTLAAGSFVSTRRMLLVK